MEKIPPSPDFNEDVTDDQIDEIKRQVEYLDSEQLDHEFALESERWAHIGMNPMSNIRIDQFKLQMEMRTLLQVIFDAGIITEEDFELKTRREMLTFMIVLRTNHQRFMIRNRILEGVPKPNVAQIIKPGDV